jgi:hypothetical protein
MFPDFDENLRRSMRRETELLLDSVTREDRSVLTLLDADYTFVDERLARHYGIPNVYGSHFRRVAVTDPNRRGLLGHASILTVTSQANRTSPVTRGKWILENLLGAPPPSPPDNIPALEATKLEGTLRQRMEQHRKNPVCSSCHNVMDPLGFSLENFDPLGQWRTVDSGFPVDASGAMPDGSRFEGVAGLRAALLARPNVFVGTLTEKLMIYALGRGLEYYDMPAVRAVTAAAARDNYRFSKLIEGIVTSVPFRMRTAAAHDEVKTLAARGESPAAFDGRCIPAGCVAPPSNTPGILGRRALPAGRLARLGATPAFHHGLLDRCPVSGADLPQRGLSIDRAGIELNALARRVRIGHRNRR